MEINTVFEIMMDVSLSLALYQDISKDGDLYLCAQIIDNSATTCYMTTYGPASNVSGDNHSIRSFI